LLINSFFLAFCFNLSYAQIMTIEQTVEIPADHRLILEVPREIPAGRTRVELKFTPMPSASCPLERETDEKKKKLARFCGIWTPEDAVEFEAVTKEFGTVNESDWK
jgi:hypothetical protein